MLTIELIRFETADVITASSPDDNGLTDITGSGNVTPDGSSTGSPNGHPNGPKP